VHTDGSNARRYAQFAILVLAAGALYPIMYLRQNFEISLIEALGITASDLGDLNFILGVVFALSYIPSGILADTVQPRVLMSFALVVVGALGFWMSTWPSLLVLKLIFFGWGVAGGMCFWAALLKAVNLLARSSEQGRFFAILDGGRGLVEAILASIAILMFRELSAATDPGTVRMQPVIWLYAFTAIALGALVFFVVEDNPAALMRSRAAGERSGVDAWAWARNLWALLKLPQLWLLGFIIMLGQTLFFLTYSISAFLQVNVGLTALAAGTVTLSKLWMRPIAGFTIGFVADRYSREAVLGWLMFAASIGLLCIVFLPLGGHLYLIAPLVLVIGYLTYAIKGLYWSLLDLCAIPPHLLGLAIGIASFLGYMPDTLLPLYDGFLSRHFPRDESFRIYFSSIAGCGFLGALLCVVFLRWTRRTVQQQPQPATAQA
jgi:sugar phosphate permease